MGWGQAHVRSLRRRLWRLRVGLQESASKRPVTQSEGQRPPFLPMGCMLPPSMMAGFPGCISPDSTKQELDHVVWPRLRHPSASCAVLCLLRVPAVSCPASRAGVWTPSLHVERRDSGGSSGMRAISANHVTVFQECSELQLGSRKPGTRIAGKRHQKSAREVGEFCQIPLGNSGESNCYSDFVLT